MWLRQLRLLSLASSTMAQLVQMLTSMVIDILKFMALFVVVLFAFAAALARLISDRDVSEASPDCSLVMSRLSDVLSSTVLLFESALLGGAYAVRFQPREPASHRP